MAGHAALIGSWVRTVPPDGRHWKGGGGTGSQRVGFVTPSAPLSLQVFLDLHK